MGSREVPADVQPRVDTTAAAALIPGSACFQISARASEYLCASSSRPSREAANHLYRKAGFEVRETNVWRMTLEA